MVGDEINVACWCAPAGRSTSLICNSVLLSDPWSTIASIINPIRAPPTGQHIYTHHCVDAVPTNISCWLDTGMMPACIGPVLGQHHMSAGQQLHKNTQQLRHATENISAERQARERETNRQAGSLTENQLSIHLASQTGRQTHRQKNT